MYRISNDLDYKPVTLDVKTLKILDVLCENSRESINKISKKVELSSESTSYRIKKLTKDKTILQFYPHIDYKRLGFNTYHVFLVVSELDGYEEIIDYFRKLPNTIFIIEYTDKWDLEVVLLEKSILNLDKLISKAQAKFSESIMERQEIVEIRRYQSILFSNYFNKNIYKLDLLEENNKSEYSPDLFDKQIMEQLCINSRFSTYDISNKVNLSPDSIGNRIKRLQKEKIIKKFIILPNLSKLGYSWYTFTIKMRIFDSKTEKKFKSFIQNQPGIIRSTKTFGENDILLYIISKEQKDFNLLIKQIKSTFPTILKSYETFVAYKEHYFNAFPKVLLEN